MDDPAAISALMATLGPLLGSWYGTGKAGFPTIAPHEFEENLRFELDPDRPLIHYEQRVRHREVGTAAWQPSHWESGFLRPLDSSTIEMTNAQDSGRLEIIRLTVGRTAIGVRLEGSSTQLVNDPRMVGSRREFEVAQDVLTYTVWMATTRVPEGHVHLNARLVRIAGHGAR